MRDPSINEVGKRPKFHYLVISSEDEEEILEDSEERGSEGYATWGLAWSQATKRAKVMDWKNYHILCKEPGGGITQMKPVAVGQQSVMALPPYMGPELPKLERKAVKMEDYIKEKASDPN